MSGTIYVTCDPEEHAGTLKDILLRIGCSEGYAEDARRDALTRIVRVGSSYEANAILCGRERKEEE